MEPILLFTGASANTLEYAVDYLSIYLLGTIFVEISTGLNSFINAQGRPAIAMFSVLIGALLNIILDPIFIFGFNMGVKGAALATVLSQADFPFFQTRLSAFGETLYETGQKNNPFHIGFGSFSVHYGEHGELGRVCA